VDTEEAMAMRHGMVSRRFDRPSDERLALFRGLVTDLLRHEQIKTTEAKAKAIRPMAEKMITLGKSGSLASRRRVLGYVYDKDVASKVFDELAERYATRPGGYTRIVRLGTRKGDGAPVVQIELV
jgi:large subunit ribosomal protein L17